MEASKMTSGCWEQSRSGQSKKEANKIGQVRNSRFYREQ